MKKRIILCFLALTLCVTVSYSWILDSVHEPASVKLSFDMRGTMNGRHMTVVSDTGYSIEVYKYVTDGEPVLVDAAHPLSFDGMLPGESLRFKIRLRNENAAGEVLLYMTGITCTYNGSGTCDNPEKILDSIYISVNAGDGYNDPNNPNISKPSYIYSKLSDLQRPESDSTVIIYTNLPIPYTAEDDDYVELECRFWFDTNAEDLEDISMSFGSFVLSI